ncbi:MAG: hypothetical protein JEZ11_00365 [Desulfobacterales bacterium]|nr:hypothetical protein [Desulfobacterales bacterium]
MTPASHLSRPHYRQFVSLVAHQHGCMLVDIDFSGGTIHLTGADEAIRSCGKELERLMGLSRQKAVAVKKSPTQ